MSAPARKSISPKDTRSQPAPDEHLSPDDIYDLIEKRLSGRKLRSAEAHLDRCAECVETLAMVLRSERPASREEQELLASMPEPTPSEFLAAIRPHIGSPSSKGEWKPIAMSILVGAVLFGVGFFVYDAFWLPAQSRRAAAEALDAMVELRQATGRLPLRYINEFERAGIVRSSFDTTDDAEQAIIANLRAAVAEAPEPEALLVLGLLLLDDGKLDEAEMLLERVRQQRPDSVDAINGLAVVYYEKARREPDNAYALQQKGLALLREAERLSPDDLRVLYNYGKFYEALGMPGAAIKAWERYLEHDQTSQWADQAAMELAQ